MQTQETRVYMGRQGGLQIHRFDNATDADLLAVAPSIFATAPDHNRTKATYQHVNTGHLIAAMRAEGWAVTAAGQKFTRDEARFETTRHFVRLRHTSADEAAEYVPEGILLNAHDGTASWKLFAGAFRFVCANGLMLGQLVDSVKAHHTMRQAGEAGALALAASRALLTALPEKMGVIETLRGVHLTEAQVLEYYTRAIAIRYRVARGPAPITTAELAAAPRLEADMGDNAWVTFNHVQRWLVEQGAIAGTTATGRHTQTRPVTRVDKMVGVNVGLWDAMLDLCGLTTRKATSAPTPEPVAATAAPQGDAPTPDQAKADAAPAKKAKPSLKKSKAAAKRPSKAKKS